ncbi:MAG: hypothetical protein KVP17_000026 [Porospora cf. gigantea B]|nr:MAG: hypothetical protein KVP17_000026 [Porospora cf. gigantea B]
MASCGVALEGSGDHQGPSYCHRFCGERAMRGEVCLDPTSSPQPPNYDRKALRAWCALEGRDVQTTLGELGIPEVPVLTATADTITPASLKESETSSETSTSSNRSVEMNSEMSSKTSPDMKPSKTIESVASHASHHTTFSKPSEVTCHHAPSQEDFGGFFATVGPLTAVTTADTRKKDTSSNPTPVTSPCKPPQRRKAGLHIFAIPQLRWKLGKEDTQIDPVCMTLLSSPAELDTVFTARTSRHVEREQATGLLSCCHNIWGASYF